MRHGEAILARFPGHPALEARVATSRGIVLSAEGRFEEAVQEEQRAIAVQESLLGPKSMDVANSFNNAAVYLEELGRYEEAEASIRRARTIYADIFGEDSGKVGLASLNEGEILAGLKRFEAARAAHARARAIFEQQGAGAFVAGYLLMHEGKWELEEGNARRAVSTLERALPQIGDQDTRWTADARFALARALWQTSPTGRKRATELARSAGEMIADQPAAAGLARAIGAWLREHAPSSAGGRP